MCISGFESSSVNLSQRSKNMKMMPKSAKQGTAKKDGVLNPQYNNFNKFLIR